MGIFDRIRKGQQPGNFGLDDVVKAYGLKKQKPYEPSMMGTWWEGAAGVTRFAVQEHGDRLFAHIGTIAEVTEIYLGRVSDRQPLPPSTSPGNLGRIVQNHKAAELFVLLAWPEGEFDLPGLRNPDVLDRLVRFSPAVVEVMIYDNYKGVTLVFQRLQDRAQFDRDLACGVEIVKALAGAGM